MKVASLVRVALLACSLTLGLMGQATGELTGGVSDASGASIPGVELTLTQQGTGVSVVTTSNEQGLYRFENLTPGRHELTTKHSVFAPTRLTDIVVELNRLSRADVGVQITAAQQEISVVANAQLLDFDSSTHRHIMNERQIESLPLQTKNVMALITLTPGVATLNGGAAVNRQGGDATAITSAIVVNGVSARITAGSTNSGWTGSASRIAGKALYWLFPRQMMFRNFRFSRAASRPTLATRSAASSATSPVRGATRFTDFCLRNYRGTATNARRAIPALSPRPPNNYNQFGGTGGGPVFIPKVYDGRNRTFFFMSFDGTRWVRNNPAFATVPTAKMHNGDFSETTAIIYDPASAATPAAWKPFPNQQIPLSPFRAGEICETMREQYDLIGHSTFTSEQIPERSRATPSSAFAFGQTSRHPPRMAASPRFNELQPHPTAKKDGNNSN